MKTLNHPSEYLPMPRKTWPISIALLGSLFLLAISVNGQAEVTAIAKTAVELEDLIVTTVWPESAPPDQLEIAVLDENDLQIAAQLVWPRPGEDTDTTFDDFLHNLEESGFQFSAIVRDAEGREVSERLAFRVVIECPLLTEPCQWSTQDGLYTTAIAITEPLRAALDTLETSGSRSLLEDILAEQPDLRGPVFTLAAQLDRLDQKLGLEGSCGCAWYQSSHGDKRDCQECAEGSTPEDPGVWVTVAGDDAYAFAGGVLQHPSGSFKRTSSGTREQTLELRCQEISGWTEDPRLPKYPSLHTSPRPIRFPIVDACPALCFGTVSSFAAFKYHLSTNVVRKGIASASVEAFLETDYGSNLAPPVETCDCDIELDEPSYATTLEGSALIPASGTVEHSDVRRVTAKLWGTATIDLQAEKKDSWSYGEARFTGRVLKMVGDAACALEPTGIAELTVVSGRIVIEECGEQLIEDWNTPPPDR